MENSQTKRSTRSAAPPAVSAEMPELKEEPIDDDISLDHTRQAATETTHQEGFLSSGARDPFLDEMEIGETSITFPNAFLDAFGQDVKTEQPTAEESDLNAEAVEAAGSSTAKRKNCDDEESEEDSSSATKRLPNSSSSDNILLNKLAPALRVSSPLLRQNTQKTVKPTTTRVQSTEPSKCTYIIRMLNDDPTKPPSKPVVVSADQVQKLQRVPIEQIRALKRVAAPPQPGNVLNPRIRVKNFATMQPTAQTAMPSVQKDTQQNSSPSPHSKEECTHCPCFEKFVKEHDQKMDTFLTKQQRIVSEILNLQRHIMNKLHSIESTLESQPTGGGEPSFIEHSDDDSAHSPIPFNLPNTIDEASEPNYAAAQQNGTAHINSEEVQLFSFTRMEKAEELNEFDRRLADAEYFKETYNWLNSLITETNCANRMLVALDLLFDKVFVNKCSWTGRGKGNSRKVPLRCRRNLLHLFKVIGSTRRASVSRSDVEDFFIKKLKQSKQRLNLQGIRKATCHVKRTQLS
uniref:DUF4806 domain-containing protein n=2 Tax=Anopheles arabiensis TaxID=7173 RepID=A0A182HP88_ANOAR